MAEPRITYDLGIREVERIAFRLAQEHLQFDEPIPDFSTRFPNILESCINMPFLKVYGKSLYPSLASKATILFYLIIKNHPFVNGNKRIAVTTLMVFLMKNKKRLKAELQELHDLTIWVAESEPKDKNFILMATEQFIRKNMENFGG